MKFVRAVICISPLLLGPCPCAFGQNAPRWEFGPSISMMSLTELDNNRGFGFGARAVWNISEWLGTELQAARIRESTTHYQSTANVKATWRLENSLRVNPFALAGVGGRRDTSLVPYPAGLGFLGPPQNSVALRFGGGIEVVPHKRLSIRLDASNLASRVPSASGSGGAFAPARWWNRLDVSLSTMVRFGSVGSRGR
jgi:hypothetical protein